MGRVDVGLKCIQVRSLIEKREYEEAYKVAEKINLDKVKSIVDLKIIASVYERLGKYEEAKDILLRSYEKKPTKMAVYRLAYLSVKTEEFDDAEFFYQEFSSMAPNSPDRYILRYGIDRAKGVDYLLRIATLQKLKQIDYMEEWGYELAKVYHKAGLYEDCIRECNDLITWFGDGIIVEKAQMLRQFHKEGKESLDPYGVFDEGLSKQELEARREQFISDTQDLKSQAIMLAKQQKQQEIQRQLDRDLEKTVDLRKVLEEEGEDLDLLKQAVHRVWGEPAPEEHREAPEREILQEPVKPDTRGDRSQKAVAREEIPGDMHEFVPPQTPEELIAASLAEVLTEEERHGIDSMHDNWNGAAVAAGEEMEPVSESRQEEKIYEYEEGILKETLEENYTEDASQENIEESYTEDALQENIEENYAENPMQEEIENSYAEDALSENIEENYAEDPLQEETENNYTEDILQENIEENYAENPLQEETESSYAEDALQENMEESYVENPMQEETENSYTEDALQETEDSHADESLTKEAENPVQEEILPKEDGEDVSEDRTEEEPNINVKEEKKKETETIETLADQEDKELDLLEEDTEIPAYVQRKRDTKRSLRKEKKAKKKRQMAEKEAEKAKPKEKKKRRGFLLKRKRKADVEIGQAMDVEAVGKELDALIQKVTEREEAEIAEYNTLPEEALQEREKDTRTSAIESAELSEADPESMIGIGDLVGEPYIAKPKTEKAVKAGEVTGEPYVEKAKTEGPIEVGEYVGEPYIAKAETKSPVEVGEYVGEPYIAKSEKADTSDVEETVSEEQDGFMFLSGVDLWEYFSAYEKDRRLCEDIQSTLERIKAGERPLNMLITCKQQARSSQMGRDMAKAMHYLGFTKKKQVARVTAEKLNRMHLEKNYDKLEGGFLLVENAKKMTADTAQSIMNMIECMGDRVVVILTDARPYMDDLMNDYKMMRRFFPYDLKMK